MKIVTELLYLAVNEDNARRDDDAELLVCTLGDKARPYPRSGYFLVYNKKTDVFFCIFYSSIHTHEAEEYFS